MASERASRRARRALVELQHGSLLAVVRPKSGKDRAARAVGRRERERSWRSARHGLSRVGGGTTARSFAMPFLAYSLSVELVRRLREPFAVIRRYDSNLARQATRAMTSVPLNVAEGNGRVGRDRLHHFRIALGSLREVGAALEVAVAVGWLERAPLAAERDRLCGILYGCQRD
jgi:four helix bundle protein